MEIVINGQREIYPADTIAGLVEGKGLPPESLVVELNGAIVKQEHWPTIRLQEGDALELLSFVGGG